MITMPRKMVSIDEETYKKLVRAKAHIEMESGNDISLGKAIGLLALGVAGGLIAAKILGDLYEEWNEY